MDKDNWSEEGDDSSGIDQKSKKPEKRPEVNHQRQKLEGKL